MNELQVIERPPADGLTIETGLDADGRPEVTAQDVERLPPSKLPADRQFSVLSGWWRADADHSREWRAEARMWFDFRAGEQWTAEDKALLDDQERPHIVFNRVLTVLKAVAGMEINGRHEISFIPRNTEDTAVNEVLTAASKWMADTCDGEDEESQAFDDTTTCGMGWCENRLSYEDDPAGLYVEENICPFEMYWDRTARKKNLSDSRRRARVRRMALGDAMDMFPGFTRDQLDAVWAADGPLDYPKKTLEQKWKRDTANTSDDPYDDQCEVTIVAMQWIERECYYLVADAEAGTKIELSEAEYKVFEARMRALADVARKAGADPSRFEVVAAKLYRKVYLQAFLGAEGVMLRPAGPAPLRRQFSWECITGELDKVKGTWFGLVKIMRDPAMWANKWVSQILHILNSTAKGGIIAERTAFDDERDAEDGYAQSDSIVWAADGALSGANPKIIPRPGVGMTEGYVGLLAFAVSSIKDVTGINLELLGQQDQNQPGILEAMRKQAGMTVLATLFDSLRRFRKRTGRARLFLIQNFLSDGRLIRVAGEERVEAIRLSRDKTVGDYDVVVDDTPTSPNQKEANWAIIQPLLAVFKDQLISNPEVFVILLEYSPLPSRVVEAIKSFVTKAKQDPKAQQEAQENRAILVGTAQAKIARDQAAAEKDQSAAALNAKKAESEAANMLFDIAMARNLLDKNDADGLKAQLEALETRIKAMGAEASARKADAEVGLTRAKTVRELAGVQRDREEAEQARMSAEDDRLALVDELRRGRVSDLIEHLTAQAGVTRDLAAAEKDRAIARRPAPAASA